MRDGLDRGGSSTILSRFQRKVGITSIPISEDAQETKKSVEKREQQGKSPNRGLSRTNPSLVQRRSKRRSEKSPRIGQKGEKKGHKIITPLH